MIEIIKNKKIQNALLNEHRQYLVGDLKLPQPLEHIYDDKVEMGITRFEKYACEKPHYHPVVTEYQIILNGEAKYVDIEANQEYMVQTGDVFVIRPNTTYIQKSTTGTVILFFKYPSGNDKMLVDVTPQMRQWSSAWQEVWSKEATER